jgi:aspartyl-tRNA(Asn)/glutamyl-tRNA(Gln) amidotransferase subunit B
MYVPTIGLEIHAHLKTRTKMFCACLNDPDTEKANANICPVCTGHPGTLPVPNKEAIEQVLKVGMALSGDVPATSKFDRKNYFYPDLPKGYQISQYDLPLISNGVLNGIRIRRIHLEEDAGRLVHADSSTLVDYNRAGTPLMELVTEPDIKSVAEATDFGRELQLVLRYLEVSDADMEKGQMRVEVNISMSRIADKRRSNKEISADQRLDQRESVATSGALLGTKVEVKNINSFKAAAGAIEYEMKRQTKLLEEGRGDEIIQETRGWDDLKQMTISQRTKEGEQDYRYFPEPDIPPLDLSLFDLKRLKNEIPELPQAKRARFKREFGLNEDVIDVLVSDKEGSAFFENAISELEADNSEVGKKQIQLLANYMNADLRGLMIERGVGISNLKITPENFADLIALISKDKVTSRVAKDILRKMFDTGADPNVILEDENLEQVSDESALLGVVKKIIETNPKAVADYKKGQENAVMFLVGKAMAELKGAGNPQVLKNLFVKEIGK